MMAAGKPIAIGKIVGVHGIRGSLKVKSFCDDPAIFDTPYPVAIPVAHQKTASYRIATCRIHGKVLIIDLEGITTREQAERLVGAEMLLPESSFPAPEEGTYYWFELIGFEVRTLEEKFIGTVYRLISAGPNDMLVVHSTDSEVLIPMVGSFVKSIEKSQRLIWVDLPEGMPIEKRERRVDPQNGDSCIS